MTKNRTLSGPGLADGGLARDAAPARRKPRIALFLELAKGRLVAFSLATVAVGHACAARGQIDPGLLALTLAGAVLATAGSGVLNQWMERDRDALMRRTRARPLPSGAVRPGAALTLGLALLAAGLAVLFLFVNPAAATLTLAGAVVYNLVYTPLKTRTALHAFVGAVAGALPPVMGWVSATGSVSPEAVALGALVYFWQIPHSLAHSFLYRQDNIRAGFRAMKNPGPSMFLGAILVPCLALFMAFEGLAGPVFAAGATAAGAWFADRATRFCRKPNADTARTVFLGSLAFLWVLLILLLFDSAAGRRLPWL